MWFFGIFFGFFWKLLRLLLKVTEVTTEHQKWPEISTNSIKIYFFTRMGKKASAKGQSPPQVLEVNPHSGLYILVLDHFEQFCGVKSGWLPCMCGLQIGSSNEAQQCTLCSAHGPTTRCNCHFWQFSIFLLLSNHLYDLSDHFW